MSDNCAFNLADLELFQEFDAETLAYLHDNIERIHIDGGQTLFRQGDTDDSMYLVVSGRLSAILECSSRGQVFVGEMAQGETIGEMSVLSDETRSVTVLALRDSELVCIPSQVVRRLFELRPQFLLELSRMLVKRLKQAYRPMEEHGRVRSIALVFLDETVDPRAVSNHFEIAFRQWGSVLFVSPDRYAASLGIASSAPETGLSGNIVNWLNAQESAHDFILYPTSSEPSDWNSISLRQADRILFIAGSNGYQRQSAAEERLWQSIASNPFPRCELVRLRESPASSPKETGLWFAERNFHRHHQVVADRQADYDRVVRLLTGRSVGLVLGGGGARGFAHIGVIRALGEYGIPIDHLAGTSMGAFVAAEAAMGMDYQDMLDINREVFILSNPTNDYTLPLVSLLAGKKCDCNLRQVFDDTRIEDLRLPFFCVSANLTTSHAMIHDRGPVWEAIRASISIPGIFPPVFRNGQVLVDGGIVDMLPINTARNRHPGQVIAVEVSGGSRLTAPKLDSISPSTWDFLTDRARSGTQDHHIPTILQILMATGTIGADHSTVQARSQADLYIAPQVEEFDTLDWRPLAEIAEAGYRAASQVLSQGNLPIPNLETKPGT